MLSSYIRHIIDNFVPKTLTYVKLSCFCLPQLPVNPGMLFSNECLFNKTISLLYFNRGNDVRENEVESEVNSAEIILMLERERKIETELRDVKIMLSVKPVVFKDYTCRHLHQRIEEHKRSAIGNHLREQRDIEPEDIAQNFRILRKCQNKLDCLTFEMLFIKELKPSLNKQCDSIRAKLFV